MAEMPGFEGLDDPPSSQPATVKSQGFDRLEYKALLSLAANYADNEWEDNFIEQQLEKLEEYGVNAFLSDAQLETLQRIAGEESA
ncbi:MAG: hypothetical protein U9Q19_05445 [Pseudomonadota bacterium]|nr:hypothetical protein [Pseudomonadota bacterium]